MVKSGAMLIPYLFSDVRRFFESCSSSKTFHVRKEHRAETASFRGRSATVLDTCRMMPGMTNDDSAPLTKADGKKLKEEICAALRGELRKEIQASEQRTVQHMELLFENFRSDFLGMKNDQVIQHQQTLHSHGVRITRIERHLRLSVWLSSPLPSPTHAPAHRRRSPVLRCRAAANA